MQDENAKAPHLIVLIASILFGFTAILTKMLIDTLTPIAVLVFRFIFLIFTYPLIVFAINKNTAREIFFLTKNELKTLLMLSFFLVADMVLFFESFYFIDVSKALLLFLTYPIMSLIIARIFLNEGIGMTEIATTAISITGVFLIFWKNFNIGLFGFKGEMMVLAAAFLWAAYIVMNHHSGDSINHHKKTFWIFALNSLFLLPLLLLYGKPLAFLSIKPFHLVLLLTLSVFSTLIPYALMSYAARSVKSSTSSIILLLGPVLGVIASFAVLHEKPPMNVIAGGSFILMSAFISTYSIQKLFAASKYYVKRVVGMFS